MSESPEVFDTFYLVWDDHKRWPWMVTADKLEAEQEVKKLENASGLRYTVTSMTRRTTYQAVECYKSAVTGMFVSEAFALANPDTTYMAKTRRPVWSWADNETEERKQTNG